MSTGKTSRELVEELERRNALLEARLSKLEKMTHLMSLLCLPLLLPLLLLHVRRGRGRGKKGTHQRQVAEIPLALTNLH